MRISDWSSDVCSSDLEDLGLAAALHRHHERQAELCLIGLVQRGEAGALGIGEQVEPGRGLLLRRDRREAPGPYQAPGEVGMRRDECALLRLCCGAPGGEDRQSVV